MHNAQTNKRLTPGAATELRAQATWAEAFPLFPTANAFKSIHLTLHHVPIPVIGNKFTLNVGGKPAGHFVVTRRVK